jgi:type IV pilus assembly protein PilB
MEQRKRFGELLVESGMITQRQLEDSLRLQKTSAEGHRIGEFLLSQGLITPELLGEIMEFYYGVPYIDLARESISPEMATHIPVTMARRHKLVPVRVEGGRLLVAMDDPFNIVALEDIKMVSKIPAAPLAARESLILDAIEDLYGNIYAEKAIEDFKRESSLHDAMADVSSAGEGDVGNAPIVRLINSILEQAIRDGASDIHIEPMEGEVRVRLRIDGTLHSILSTPKNAHAAMLTRIKIIGNLNITEKRVPQDGRCELDILGHNTDVRISTMPTVFGEKAAPAAGSLLLFKTKIQFGLNPAESAKI